MPADGQTARRLHITVGRRALMTAALAAVYLCGTLEAGAQRCEPRRKLPPVVLTTLGPCLFDPETFSFAGDPRQQAQCLMRSATARRNLGPPLETLPAPLATRVGQPTGLPERETVGAHLAEVGLVWDFAPFLWQPLSRARDNDPDAPQARYLVIHDTSAPNFGRRPFPVNLDDHRGINNLGRFRCVDGWEPAHAIINRGGAVMLGHEFGEPWRAMRFERATRFGTDLKGLFLHVELVQPRRSQPGRGRNNDAQAPTPGFSDIQYDRLALIYTIASVRAERWLIPAFHIAIDSGIRGGHDDPQNFDIEAFAGSLHRLMTRLERTTEIRIAEAAIEPSPAQPPDADRPVAQPAEQTTAAVQPAPPVEAPVAESLEPPSPPAVAAEVAEVTPPEPAIADEPAAPTTFPPVVAMSTFESVIESPADHPAPVVTAATLRFVPEMFLLFPLGWAILATRGRDRHGPAGRDGRV